MKAVHALGFTLIEVLIALSILAIALTALIKASTSSIVGTQHLQHKNMAHIVAMQGIARIQLGLSPVSTNQDVTETLQLFGVPWRWHAHLQATGLEKVDRITITTSSSPQDAFHDPIIAFRAVR